MEEYPEITEFFLNVSTNIFAEVDSGGRVIYANNKAEYAFRLQSAATLDKAFDEDTAAVLKKHLHNTFFSTTPKLFSLNLGTLLQCLYFTPAKTTQVEQVPTPPAFSPSAPNQTTIGICRTDSQTGILGAGYSGKTFLLVSRNVSNFRN